MTSGEKLCLACGLCCDGTLFGHVRLGTSDDPEKLEALGMAVLKSRAKAPVLRLRQPCRALCADGRCRIYADRPSQCRHYACGVYRQLQSGRVGLAAALRRVKQAKLRAGRVRRLLHELGDTDEHRSLDERFQRAQQRLESGAVKPAEADVFAELTQAAHAFQLLAHDAFYTRPEEENGGGGW